jgi:F-type H+-transporting ATPase subunit b
VEINITIIGQMITFAILIIFTMKFVWPPINNMLEERAKKIAEGLSAAEKGKQELLNAEAKVVEELKHVQLRATEIMVNAEKRASQIIQEAKDSALKEGERIINDARTQLENDIIKAREVLQSQVSSLVIKGAEQILKIEIDAKKHTEILSKIKAELGVSHE